MKKSAKLFVHMTFSQTTVGKIFEDDRGLSVFRVKSLIVVNEELAGSFLKIISLAFI
jgi:hypothetical protein